MNRHVLAHLLALSLLVAWLVPATVCDARTPSPTALLAAYLKTLKPYERFSCRMVEKSYMLDHPPFPAGYLFSEATTSVWIDGARRKEISTKTVHRFEKKRKTVGSSRSASEQILARGRLLDILIDRAKGGAESVSVILDESKPENQLHAARLMPFQTGMLLDERDSLPAILKAGELTAREDRLDGREAVVLHGESEWGTHSLWLDPARDHVPLLLEARKQGQHKGFDGQRLKDVPPSGGGPFGRSDVVVRAMAVEKVQGRWVVTGYTIDQDYTRGAAKGRIHDRRTVDLHEVAFPENLDDAFVPTTPVPDGMQVTVIGQEMIKHEWRGGEIVKSVDRSSVAALESASFKPGGGAGWLFWVLLSVVLLAVGGGLWWLTRSRASEAAS
ncbi:MAG: hypothetical protein K2W96_21435 [Gemmataceae bacterium]|nr:hypothetical protein [Gemmataceae bacterium]